MCEEEATEEEKAEAAGAELKTKTPHNDVGKKSAIAFFKASIHMVHKTKAKVRHMLSPGYK